MKRRLILALLAPLALHLPTACGSDDAEALDDAMIDSVTPPEDDVAGPDGDAASPTTTMPSPSRR